MFDLTTFVWSMFWGFAMLACLQLLVIAIGKEEHPAWGVLAFIIRLVMAFWAWTLLHP